MKNKSNGEKPEDNTRNCLGCIFTVLISTAAMQMVVLLGLVIHWKIQRDNHWSPRQQQMCYPQSKLIAFSDSTDCPQGIESKFDESKNETSCCGQTNEIINRILNKTLLNRYNSKINPEKIFFDLEKVHCKTIDQQISVPRLGLRQGRKSVAMKSGNKLFWDSSASSFENTGLTYLEEKGQVTVEKEGYFYIMLQLKMNVSNIIGGSDDDVKHHVHKESDSIVTTILLEDVTSPCQMTSDSASVKTSVLGAVFWLKQGERLHVTTSHPDSIITDPLNNHFSVYML